MNKFLKIQFGKRNKFLKRLEFNNYSEYLKSDIWHKIKKTLRKNLSFSYCWVCGSTEKINLHHIRYNLLYHSKIKKDIIPLCEKCHHEVHKISLNLNLSLKASVKKLKIIRQQAL